MCVDVWVTTTFETTFSHLWIVVPESKCDWLVLSVLTPVSM